MKKSIKILICALCLVFCLGMLAGCGDTGTDATATPAPTGNATSNATSSSDAQDPYLRPRDESLKNAIKEGETYRYFIYTTNDPSNPFEADSDENREFNLNRKSHYEAAYGITIEYVVTVADWANSFVAAGVCWYSYNGYIPCRRSVYHVYSVQLPGQSGSYNRAAKSV